MKTIGTVITTVVAWSALNHLEPYLEPIPFTILSTGLAIGYTLNLLGLIADLNKGKKQK